MLNQPKPVTSRLRIAVAGATAHLALLEDVAEGSSHAYHLTGARNWTMPQIAEELSHLLGRRISYGNRSLAEQQSALLADGLPPLVAELLVGLDHIFHESVLSERTDTVEALTGTAPRQLTEWLRKNLATFKN